ncbi:MAG: type II secretion system protein [Candidatus Paceibacterota bacterium]
MKQQRQRTKGFTLLEALISVTLFAIVMTIAVGALVTIVDSNRKSQSMQLSVNNVNAAVDHMSWQIRGGSDYFCIDGDGNAVQAENCTSANQQPGIGFTGREGSLYSYELVDGRIQRTVGDESGNFQTADITSSSSQVMINRLGFSLFGDKVSGTQPAVTIVVQGEAGVEGDTMSEFNIQTSVSERFNVVYDGGSNASDFSECPFLEIPGRTIIDIVNIKGANYTVRADHSGQSGGKTVSGPEEIPEELRLDAGNYKVSAATFDNHYDEQTGEIGYFGLLNEEESQETGHEGQMFVYTSLTEDIPHDQSPEFCSVGSNSSPECWRGWSGVIEESLYLEEEAYAIKIFHGQPMWQTFLHPYSSSNPAHTEAAGRQRAVNFFKHSDENPAAPVGDYVVDRTWSPSSHYNSANSFVPLCLAFDNLDVTPGFEIEDF